MDTIIRTATLADLDAVAAVEAACFPAAEAATALRARIGDGALEELPRIAVPAVVRQRVHAEDHLPRAVRIVQ